MDSGQRAEPVTVAGVPVLMLSSTDLLLHLCVHLSVDHGFDGIGLRPFLDLAEVQHRFADAIDWGQFTKLANTWGVASGVRLALQLAQQWTGLELPPHVLSSLDAVPVDAVTADWVRHKVFHASSADLQSDAVRFAGTAHFADHLRLARTAMAPFRASLAGMRRSPGSSWRNLRDYLGPRRGILGPPSTGPVARIDARQDVHRRRAQGSAAARVPGLALS